ncbi:MAG: hypothetical protein PHI97_17025 [Desulfobulbus sp.]|nr:hypothetical protein [Desulfobulbus sp.]
MTTPQTYPLLEIDVPTKVLPAFASLLQHGVLFPLQHPIPLLSFLVTLPGFTADYIEENVQTIFINGVAADSLDRELVDGTTVALSAAMPGLAGAIFRRQGVHGSLRSRPATEPTQVQQTGGGYLTLKLFNSIGTDRIGDLLQQGILISGKALASFARMHEQQFAPPACLRLENQEITYSDLLNKTEGLQRVKVQLAR